MFSFQRALRRTMNLFALFGLFFLVGNPSFGRSEWFGIFQFLIVWPIYTIYTLHLATGFYQSSGFLSFLANNSIDLVFFAPLLAVTSGGVHPAHVLIVRQFVHYFIRYLQSNTLSNFAQSISDRPARLIAFSFFGIILIGAFLLTLPISVSGGNDPSFLTALFTSTSAVCVTGLIVVDTPSYFSTFGQLVVLTLIQIGGLGIMTLSAGSAFLIGKRLGISERSVLQNVLDATDLVALRRTLLDILKWTFAIEFIGSVILSIRFKMVLECPALDAFYLGVFHSISAFCNAGFALFSDNLMKFSPDPVINLAIMGLIVMGGLGFSVLSAINGFLQGDQKFYHDMHSLMVLSATVILIVGGTIALFALEYDKPTLGGMPIWEKLFASAFQSVTARTAGFNTIDFGMMTQGALFLTIVLMFIGASPGSTGGGIKTTTVGTMLLALDAQMKGMPEVVLNERTIPSETIAKAFLITVISASIVVGCTFMLLLTESFPLINILFEVVSAFGTVGLSTGITPSVSIFGKLVLIFLMFIGRIGPLTWALSFRTSSQSAKVSYPVSRILVG